MSSLTKEIGFALRSLRKNPGFAATAIVTLALGIGASTAIFSVVNAILLRPLPYEDPERLAIVWADLRHRNVVDFPFAPGDFQDLREQGGEVFSGIAALQTGRQTITDDANRPEMVRMAFATSNIFDVLGMRAAIGRTFFESDGIPQPPPPQPVARAQSGAAAAPAPPPFPTIVVPSHANLLLLRASARERELAVRAALGGSRWAIVRQLLSESLVLAGIGAGIGVLLAQGGIDLLVALAPTNLPRMDTVRIDVWVLLFTIGASLLSAVLFGLAPALRASRPNLADVLRSGRAASQFGGSAIRTTVVVAAVALSFVLLVGSGLMLRSFIKVASVDPGYEHEGLLTFALQNPRLQGTDAHTAFMNQFTEKLRAIPGVSAVSQAGALPLDGSDPNGRWVQEHLQHDEQAFRQAQFFGVNPSYIQTMRTPIVSGRVFTDADVIPFPAIPPNAPQDQVTRVVSEWEQVVKPVMVDELFAQKAYPGESAVGKRFMARRGSNVMTPYEIVGVVKHQRHSTIVGDEREMIFFPQLPMTNARWIVRTSATMAGLPQLVRAALAEIDPQVPISDVEPMSFYVDRAMAPTRFALVMLSIFAVIAAVLAAVGLYGVLASAVRQRTAEIGVRMAFGAPSTMIFRMVVGQGLRLSVVGVAIGLVGALVMTGAMRTMLVGVTATDPVTYGVMALLFVGLAAFACWVPARRAAAFGPQRCIAGRVGELQSWTRKKRQETTG